MYTAIKGVYENGTLTFTEAPPPVERSEVVILFMKETEGEKNTSITDKKTGVVLGSLSHKDYRIPDNFNDPLEDMEDYI
jgi:hypothetical protein